MVIRSHSLRHIIASYYFYDYLRCFRRLILAALDSEEDAWRFRQAQARANAAEATAVGALDPTPVRRTGASRPQVIETISLEKACDIWFASTKPRTLPRRLYRSGWHSCQPSLCM